MPKISHPRRLVLSRQTLRHLDPARLDAVRGGRPSNTEPLSEQTCRSICRPCHDEDDGDQESNVLTCRNKSC